MGYRFLAAMIASFAMTLSLLGAAGYAFSALWTSKPRDPLRTEFFELDLAPGWRCEKEGTEWVCRPDEQPPYGAIMIMAVKFRGPQDNLAAYEAHLRQPQTNSVAPETKPSTISYVRRNTLGERDWVEAKHIGSEVPNFNTFYLATVTAQLGILVTMSVHNSKETQYLKPVLEMMGTVHTYQR